MKRVYIFILTIILLFSTFIIVGCNKEKDIENNTVDKSVVFSDFENYKPDFQILRPMQYFGAINVNNNMDYVKSGKGSAKIQPLGIYENVNNLPYMYMPLMSGKFNFNFSDFSKTTSISMWVYNDQQEDKKMEVGLVSKIINIEIIEKMLAEPFVLKAGWNKVDYTVNSKMLAILGDIKNVQGLYLAFENEQILALENASKYYLDEIRLHFGEKEYVPEIVEKTVKKTEVVSFDTYIDVKNIQWLTSPNGTQTITWLEDYKNEKGVVGIEHSGNDWPAITFTPVQEMYKYNGYDYFVVRAYIPSAGNALKYMNLGNDTGCDSWGKDSYQKIYYDAWHDYVFDIAPFIQEWSKPTIDVGPARMWFQTLNLGVGNIYIADMSVAKKTEDITIDEEFFVGQEVTLPKLKIGNVECDGEVKLMLNNKFIYAVNNKFTPTESGSYLVIYKSVKDEIAYHAWSRIKIIKADIRKDEILSFSDKNDINNITWFTSADGTQTITQLDSFSGENGVMRIEHSGSDWPAMTFIPLNSMDKYNGYDYFVVRAYIPSAGNALKYMNLGNGTGCDSWGKDSYKKIYYDAWHDYVFDIAPFIQEWSKPTIDVGPARIWFETLNKGVGNIYIADMSVAKKTEDITIDEEFFVGQEVTLPKLKIGNGECDGEVKLMLNNKFIYAVNNKFTPTESGSYLVIYKSVKDEIAYHAWSRIKVNKADIRKDEILSFSDKNDINNITWLTSPTATQTITHLDSFSGENGVARIEHGGNDWPAITFTPIQEMSKYNGYDYFVVRAYIPSAGNALKYMFLTNQKNADTEGVDSNNKIYYDAWHDYVFKIAPFIQEWSKPTIDTFKARLSFESLNKGIGNIYIADMSVAKKADDIIIPEQNVNTQVSLPSARIAGVEVSSEITYMINGVITAVTNNAFTPTERGNVMVHYKAVKDNIAYHIWSNIKVNKADIRKDEILSFSDRGDINNIKWLTSPTATQTITHLDSFSGENGVARIEHGGNDWPAMTFIPLQEMSEYNNYTHIVIRAYIKNDANALKYMVLGNGTGCDKRTQPIVYDEWRDYVFEIEPFKLKWTNSFDTLDVGPARLWFESKSATEKGEIYIADIKAIKQ